MAVDEFGRSFKNLRISLIDSCNFACVYCTDDDFINHQKIVQPQISLEDLLNITSKLRSYLNLKSVRLTGGEPLLYPKLLEALEGLNNMNFEKISMTTNGFLLGNKVKQLKAAGLQEINISLDALNPETFLKITHRHKLNDVLEGIDCAIESGLKVKINSVIMRGINEKEIIPLLTYAKSKNIPIRYLEVMEMGHLHGTSRDLFFSQHAILECISDVFDYTLISRKPSSTANYWKTSCGATFGIIANSSAPFCSDCDRLRLDHHGKIYGCLSDMEGIDVSDMDEMLWEQNLNNALQQKQKINFKGSKMSMLNIGG